jgi:hypothetical protein
MCLAYRRGGPVQQSGLTSDRDWAGKTGRMGRSEAGERATGSFMSRHLTSLSSNSNSTHTNSGGSLPNLAGKSRIIRLFDSGPCSIMGTADATGTLVPWNLDACQGVDRADAVWVCEATRWPSSSRSNRRVGGTASVVLGATYDHGRRNILARYCRVQTL